MYTDLILDRPGAQTLWNWFDIGHMLSQEGRHEPFDKFFQNASTHVRQLGCLFRADRPNDGKRFALQFENYVPEVPKLLNELGITPIGAVLKRFKNAPTQARAGYYVWEDKATATVERVFPEQRNQHDTLEPLYAQHLIVTGSSLPLAREFNNLLSQGLADEFRVDTWE